MIKQTSPYFIFYISFMGWGNQPVASFQQALCPGIILAPHGPIPDLGTLHLLLAPPPGVHGGGGRGGVGGEVRGRPQACWLRTSWGRFKIR